jgi:hypothetical protein
MKGQKAFTKHACDSELTARSQTIWIKHGIKSPEKTFLNKNTYVQ